MKVTTWNVNGLRAREAQVLEWIARESPDIFCLQEIKASPEQLSEALCSMPEYWCHYHGHKGYSGVALLVRKRSGAQAPEFFHPDFDEEHRTVAWRANGALVASIYVPNGGKDFAAKTRFLQGMDRFIGKEREGGSELLLCGDLNVARADIDVHEKLRKSDQIGQTPGERELLEKLLAHGLIDLGRHFEPDNAQLFTWWAPWRNLRERNIGWRLDYVLASKALASRARGCRAERLFGKSDHGPVTAEFDFELS